MNCKNLPIVYVKSGIANTFDDRIEINENLPKYPKLMKSILGHELQHTDKFWSWQDFKLDFFSKGVDPFTLIGFMKNHPKATFQFLPFYWQNKRFIYDINMILMYGIFTTIILSGLLVGGLI
ncbi:MAG: hypothetical protein ACTSQ4_02420 [Candidatus Heimdallarchaeaceae archaeon]